VALAANLFFSKVTSSYLDRDLTFSVLDIRRFLFGR